MKRWTVLAVCLALLAAGCAPGETGGARFQQLEYALAGGIAGFNRQMAILSDGTYQIADRGDAVAGGKLSRGELAGLKQRLAAVDWAEIQPRYDDPQVADALLETVTLKVDNLHYDTTVGTGGLPPPALQELVTYLHELLITHLT